MFDIKRFRGNPILRPDTDHPWEKEAAFNPSVTAARGTVHIVYRAVSSAKNQFGVTLEVSSIGHAVGRDGIHFSGREQIITPEFDWEKFGCEDPRITYFEGKFYIFYTALGTYPFSAEGIKVAVAVTEDFKHFEKHLVTPFNAKAMGLFPERIQGKIAVVLTAHTDAPPAKICLALFDRIEDLWSEAYWRRWYAEFDRYVIPIDRGERDHIEVGAAPVKTKKGWLFFYSYIYNYFSPPAIFGVQAVLLNIQNPQEVVGEVKRPFLIPDEDYELYGKIPKIVFPSGAYVLKNTLHLYYGAADTTSCLATIALDPLLEKLIFVEKRQLKRFEGNPIISPSSAHAWEEKATFNPGALVVQGKVAILYRAMSDDNTSVIGCAISEDGLHIAERLPEPAYVPREAFEAKLEPGGNSGCEDPRLTRVGDTVYMCYTAYDGKAPPRVALTSIAFKDFAARKWNWTKPILISPPGVDDKDAAIFPKKIKEKYVILHRLGVSIWIDFVDSLDFKNGKFLRGEVLMNPRETAWDSKRIGIAAPPIETKYGWLLLYHGISRRTSHYHVRAALLDLKDPRRVLYRIHDAILEPKMDYEKQGIVANVVFPCGAVVLKNKLFVYYGGADKVTGVATIKLKDLIETISHDARFHARRRLKKENPR